MIQCACGHEMPDMAAILAHECEHTKAEADWWNRFLKSITNVPVTIKEPNELFRKSEISKPTERPFTREMFEKLRDLPKPPGLDRPDPADADL